MKEIRTHSNPGLPRLLIEAIWQAEIMTTRPRKTCLMEELCCWRSDIIVGASVGLGKCYEKFSLRRAVWSEADATVSSRFEVTTAEVNSLENSRRYLLRILWRVVLLSFDPGYRCGSVSRGYILSGPRYPRNPTLTSDISIIMWVHVIVPHSLKFKFGQKSVPVETYLFPGLLSGIWYSTSISWSRRTETGCIVRSFDTISPLRYHLNRYRKTSLRIFKPRTPNSNPKSQPLYKRKLKAQTQWFAILPCSKTQFPSTQ